MEKRKGREEEEGGSGIVGFNHLPPLHKFYSTRGGGGGGGESWDFYPYKASSVLPRAFPFTSAQWQELQRQALIYKHIMASVPLPPHLLLPISARAFPEAPPLLFHPTMVGGQNGFNLRFGKTNSTDPEPGRCRRTDGKKWRCSKDAAPDHKYCERHMNRGRPRSRKPVELLKNNNKKNPSNSKSAVDVDADVINADSVTKVETRYLESLEPSQQWMQPHYHEDLPNLNHTDLNHQCCPFLNPELSVPRSFIDAWSTADTDEEAKLPSLTLAMSNNADAIGGEIQMGLGLAVKPMKWTGGPLAEALQSTSNMMSSSSPSGSGKCDCVDLINLMCTKSCCGSQEVISPRDSSPSWVLHKPPVSVVSDSSCGSNNSFQWMNCQSK